MSSRDMRAVLLGLISVMLFVITPRLWGQWHEFTDALQSRQQISDRELARFQELRSTHAEVAETLRQGELLSRAADSLLIPGGSNLEMSSDFAEMLSEAARLAEVSIGSIRVNIDSTVKEQAHASRKDPLLNVSTRIQVGGSTHAVLSFINWIETTPPLLTIDEFTITAGQRNAASDEAELQVSLRVRGLAMNRPNVSLRSSRPTAPKDRVS